MKPLWTNPSEIPITCLLITTRKPHKNFASTTVSSPLIQTSLPPKGPTPRPQILSPHSNHQTLLQPRGQSRIPVATDPRLSTFGLLHARDPPSLILACCCDYHCTYLQAPVAATHHKHLPSLSHAAVTITYSLSCLHKSPRNPSIWSQKLTCHLALLF